MPIGSYVEENNYNLVKDIRPFDMPYSAYANEISTKQQYWKIGADRIKNIYDQAAGLNPQMTQNKEYLKGFMQDATKNLDKLSKSDLSVIDNSQQAARIFKPLFDVSNKFNERLIKDSNIYDHYKKQHQISDIYRTKDNGKEWNQDNEFYYRDAEQKYLDDVKAGNIDSIDSNFQNQKSFIPYYDGSQELRDIQDACKGITTDFQGINKNEMYYNVSKTSGCDPETLALAYKTQLSSRFKQQAYIHGYAAFKGNEQTLADKFTNNFITKPKTEIDKLNATILGLETGGITKEEAVKITSLKTQLKERQTIYKDNLKEYQTMTKGNPLEYIKNNYESVAGKTYFSELADSMGLAMRTDSYTEKATSNPGGLLKYKEQMDRSNMYLKNTFDIGMENLKNKHTLEQIAIEQRLKKSVEDGDNGTPHAASPRNTTGAKPQDITENSYNDLVLKPAQTEATSAWDTLTEYIKLKFPKEYEKDLKNVKFEDLDAFVKANLSKTNPDGTLKDLFDVYSKKVEKLNRVNNKIESINNKIKVDPNNKKLFDDSGYSSEKVIAENIALYGDTGFEIGRVKNTTPLSEKDMYRILNGENIGGFNAKTTIQAVSNGSSGTPVTELYYNNNKVGGVFGDGSKLVDMFYKIKHKEQENINTLNNLKIKEYTNEYYDNGGFTTNSYDFSKNKSKFEKVRGLLNVSGNENEKMVLNYYIEDLQVKMDILLDLMIKQTQ